VEVPRELKHRAEPLREDDGAAAKRAGDAQLPSHLPLSAPDGVHHRDSSAGSSLGRFTTAKRSEKWRLTVHCLCRTRGSNAARRTPVSTARLATPPKRHHFSRVALVAGHLDEARPHVPAVQEGGRLVPHPGHLRPALPKGLTQHRRL
jgi:hypothetical protein